MGVTCYSARARRALAYKSTNTFWCAIGGTAAWTNEAAPPSPVPATTALDTPIVYVLPTMVSLAAPVSSGGSVTINGQQYALISDANAVSQSARYLYMLARFDPSMGMPVANFREFGIFTALEPMAGHENDPWLAPANVVSPGVLEYLSYYIEQSLGGNNLSTIESIIEFR